MWCIWLGSCVWSLWLLWCYELCGLPGSRNKKNEIDKRDKTDLSSSLLRALMFQAGEKSGAKVREFFLNRLG